jgi:hypothetical protein
MVETLARPTVAEAMSEAPVPLKPASLLRRMDASPTGLRETISLNASAPARRFNVEAVRGSLTVEIEGLDPSTTAIAWTQNGVRIPGQVDRRIHLANLSPENTDLFYALVTTPSGISRTQAFLLTVTEGARLLNISARGKLEHGRDLIVGFVVGGERNAAQTKPCLIRVLGKSLRRLGVNDPAKAATITLFRKGIVCDTQIRREVTPAELSKWAAQAGAFAVAPSNDEPAIVADLGAGPYSVVVACGADDGGEVLVEVYQLP